MKMWFPNITGTIDVYLDVMRAICGETKGKSMVDIGCCFAPNTPKLGFKHRLYIDVIPRILDHPDEQKHFVQCDLRDIEHAMISHQFDVSIASDLIEHLTKKDGVELLKVMDRISYKQILFTPTTDLFGMAKDDDHDPEAHRSLWKPEDFPDYASIVFPDYHQLWNGGAFFAFKTPSMKYDFDRVLDELKNKVESWAKA